MEQRTTVQVELNISINHPCEEKDNNGNIDPAFHYAKYCRDIFRIRQNLQNTLSHEDENHKEEAHE